MMVSLQLAGFMRLLFRNLQGQFGYPIPVMVSDSRKFDITGYIEISHN